MLWAVVRAAIAYRQAEADGTPRVWRGKQLQDLADALDEALERLVPPTGPVNDGTASNTESYQVNLADLSEDDGA